MKALYYESYNGPESLKIKELPIPEPKENEVLIKVKYSSINDWDLGLVTGVPFVIRLLNGWGKPKKCNIPGTDCSGIVEKIGSAVGNFSIGDEVMGDLSESEFGAWAEYVAVKESELIKKPKSISFKEAAALPHIATLTMQGLFEMGNVKEGDEILINGAGGGVGLLAIQMLRDMNVHVTGVDHTDKLSKMLEMGYDEVLDYKKTDYLNSGKKYDLIFDVKTKKSPFAIAGSLKKGGIFSTVGGDLDKILMTIPANALSLNKSLRVVTLKPNKDLDNFLEIYQKKEVKVEIDSECELEEVPEMLRCFEEGKQIGKILIKIS